MLDIHKSASEAFNGIALKTITCANCCRADCCSPYLFSNVGSPNCWKNLISLSPIRLYPPTHPPCESTMKVNRIQLHMTAHFICNNEVHRHLTSQTLSKYCQIIVKGFFFFRTGTKSKMNYASCKNFNRHQSFLEASQSIVASQSTHPSVAIPQKQHLIDVLTLVTKHLTCAIFCLEMF